MHSISISHDGFVVFALSSGKEFAIDTNSVHYIAVFNPIGENDLLSEMQFEISKHNTNVLDVIQQSNLFHVKDHHSNNMLCTLIQNTEFVVADSLKNYCAFPADVCNDLICIQEPISAIFGDRFVFINLNYMDTMEINNCGIDTDSLFGFKKIDGKLEVQRGKLNNLNECYAVITFGNKSFTVKIQSLIEVLNKQQYGSYNTYRTKVIQRRLSLIVNKLIQLKQMHQLFNSFE